MRLRIMLALLDAVDALLRRGRALYLWLVGLASDATDWGPGVEATEEPW